MNCDGATKGRRSGFVPFRGSCFLQQKGKLFFYESMLALFEPFEQICFSHINFNINVEIWCEQDETVYDDVCSLVLSEM